MLTTNTPATASCLPLQLKGRRLTLARALWWALFLSAVGMNVLVIPQNLSLLQKPCVAPPCVDQQLNLAQIREWMLAGFPASSYALYTVGLGSLVAGVYLAVALVLYHSKAHDGMVFFASLTLMLFGGVTYSGGVSTLARDNALWWIPVLSLDYLGSVFLLAFLYLFPSGRFVPGWTRWVLVFAAAEQFLELPGNPPLSWIALPAWPVNVALPVVVASGL